MKWVGKREGEGLGRVGQGKDPSVCLSMKFPCGRGPRVQSQGPVLPAGRGQTEEGFLSAWVWTTGQAGGSTEPDCLFQDSDLKQYLDHCGNLMSMHNVKVRASKVGTSSWQPPVIKASVGCSSSHQLLRLLSASNAGRRERPFG